MGRRELRCYRDDEVSDFGFNRNRNLFFSAGGLEFRVYGYLRKVIVMGLMSGLVGVL